MAELFLLSCFSKGVLTSVLFSSWTEKNSSAVADYFMGDYITNCRDGIRAHPYSTSAYETLFIAVKHPTNYISSRTTNPLRYSSVKALNEIHSKPCYILLRAAPDLALNRYRRSLGKYAP